MSSLLGLTQGDIVISAIDNITTKLKKLNTQLNPAASANSATSTAALTKSASTTTDTANATSAVSDSSTSMRKALMDELERQSSQIMQKRDLNGDSQLSSTEFGVSSTKFDQIDSNDDDSVNSTELMQALMADQMAQTMSNSLSAQMTTQDANGDGALSVSEFSSSTKSFQQADVNQNGKVSLDELKKTYVTPFSNNGLGKVALQA